MCLAAAQDTPKIPRKYPESVMFLCLRSRIFLPWTYKDQPDAGHTGMTIGIRDFRNEQEVDRLPGMLALPFRGQVTDYAINRRSWGKKK